VELQPRGAVGPVSATTPARLLASIARDPTPRLTWYGAGGTRVELSGRVLLTWVAKTAHLLADEADAEPGSVVAVDLGPDWRAPIFWLAARYLGATVIGPARPGDAARRGLRADITVVPEEALLRDGAHGYTPPGGVLVVVGAAAVATAVTSPLPPGAVDYGGEVGGQPDALPAPGPQEPLGAADPRPGPPGLDVDAPGRVLRGPGTPVADLVRVWAGGGSVVWHTGLDEAVLARVTAQENVRG